MEIKGVVHLMFEQSGVFKNEFKKLGFEAYDYDIQNEFGETDKEVDLFAEIVNGYNNYRPTIFDTINKNDLIVAFFPCIFFCDASQCAFRLSHINYRKKTDNEKFEMILQRSKDREEYFRLLVMLVAICIRGGLRLIIENPYSGEHFLKNNFLQQPTIVDMDRTLRGDYFKKPTAYWFFNCKPTSGLTIQKNTNPVRVYDCKSASRTGLCSKERSLISPDYARNFICDYIIGKEQKNSQLKLFDV